MRVALIFLTLLPALLAKKETYPSDPRVVGGFDAEEGQFPYQISLQKKRFHFCGGSILNHNWILTAAHCVQNVIPNSIAAIAGINKLDADGEELEIEKIFVHPNFSGIDNVHDDIALLKLKNNIEFDDNIKPIKLVEENLPEGEEVVLSGWGTTTFPGRAPNNLQALKLKVISNEECQEAFKDNFTIYESNICTFTVKGEGACHGDSGGPLAHGDEQTGVVSWGIPCAKGKPDVFTRVQSFNKWIKDIMEHN